MVRNRKVVCLVCERSMDSDKLKRHTRIHKDLLSLSEDEVKKELRERHDIKIEREAKRRRAEEIAGEEGLSIPQEVKSIDKESVRNELIIENRFPEKTISDLKQKGHQIRNLAKWDGIVGREMIIQSDSKTHTLHGAADPRYDGYAIGW